jgi:hypothetical protein
MAEHITQAHRDGAPPVVAPSKTGGAIWVLPLLTLGVTLTGRPEPDAIAWLKGFGFNDALALIMIFTAPAIAAALAILIARILARGRAKWARFMIYALAGMPIGALMARCVTVFAGLGDKLHVGAMREATILDVAAIILGAVSCIWGLFVLIIGVGGSAAMRAMVDEMSDAEALELRRSERRPTILSGIGLIMQGALVLSVALFHLVVAPTPAITTGLTLSLSASLLASIAVSVVLWRHLDEFQKRMVLDSYAVSGILATISLTVLAALEGVGWVDAISAYAMLLTLLAVQTIAATVTGALAMGEAKGGRG